MIDTFSRDTLIAELTRDEGKRLQVYDDASGQVIRPGDTVKGWPTIGVGRNLTGNGISSTESDILLGNDIDVRAAALDKALPWWRTQTDARQRALVNLSFMGVASLLQFHRMLTAMEDGRYTDAADELLASQYAKQVGARAERIAELIKSG